MACEGNPNNHPFHKARGKFILGRKLRRMRLAPRPPYSTKRPNFVLHQVSCAHTGHPNS